MPPREPDSEAVLRKQPCPVCGNRDSLTIYSDGHGFCFSTGCVIVADEDRARLSPPPAHSKASMDLQPILESAVLRALVSRKITKATCEKFGYLTRMNGDHGEELAVYRDANHNPTSIKVKGLADKSFYWIGEKSDMLYGQWLWKRGGRMLTILEGETDTLAGSQVNGNKFAVVGLNDGAGSAARSISKQIDYVSSFDKVVILFDMDGPGRLAASEAAALLPPGKAFIGHLPAPYKDACDALRADDGKAITDAMWGAKPYRPDGVVDARELTELCLAPTTMGVPLPWKFLSDWTYGVRPGQLISLGAGTGVGKSDFLGEVAACVISGHTKYGLEFPPQGFALFNYESGPAVSKKMVAGKLAGRRFHIPNEGVEDPGMWTQEELVKTLHRMDTDLWDKGGKLFINDARGAISWEKVAGDIRYLARAEGIMHFVVDPVTALVAHETDTNKALEGLMADGWGLADELQVMLYFISHLSKPEGTPHEEGGRVQLKNFRGSNAVVMWSNFVLGLERNQQAESPEERQTTVVRMLKDRFTGNSTGKTQATLYDAIAGTLDERVSEFTTPTHGALVVSNQEAAACPPKDPVPTNSPARSRGGKRR